MSTALTQFSRSHLVAIATLNRRWLGHNHWLRKIVLKRPWSHCDNSHQSEETPPRLMLCDKIFRAVWRTNSPVLPAYLDEVMKAPHLRQQIEASLTGTSPTMKNISKPALLALRLPLPPLDVQQTLIAAIGQARTEALALRQQAKQLREQAKQEIEAALLGNSLLSS